MGNTCLNTTKIFMLAIFLSLPVLSCKRTVRIDVATPTGLFRTLVSARQHSDVETLKKLLSKSTLEWLNAEAAREHRTSESLLTDYINRLNEETSSEPIHLEEKRIDDNRVEIVDQDSKRELSRFVKEGQEWKLDGFGHPYRLRS